VFANVLLNGMVAALDAVERLHVFPHMGDGGLAAGAALLVADAPASPLEHVFLGPTVHESTNGVARSLRDVPAPDPDGALVGDLVRGRPVARCVGAMEYGPRALGHRSILAPADAPALAERMNEALRRDDFMPFAPILTAEEAERAFDVPAARGPARFMTVALPARESFRRACPAAVHVDGTARPQVVHRDEEPALHALLVRYAERTGKPALLNTSFNVHEEPIVNGPEDAVRTLLDAGLPTLRLGTRVLVNPGSNGRWDRG
jgi:carbamoyltransferase